MLEEQAKEANDRIHDIEMQWQHAAKIAEKREFELRESQKHAESDQRQRM